MPSGRICTYTPELAAKICAELAEGRSLKAICRDEGMPPESTVRGWAHDDVEGFAARFARARELGWHAMAEEALEIADETRNDTIKTEDGDRQNAEWINRSRLRVDTRKWLLSKMLPKVYGDKVTQEHTGANGGPLLLAVDRPPPETREEWLARRNRELLGDGT